MTIRTAHRASWLLAAAAVATNFGASAAPADTTAWKFSGDLRSGYFAREQTARDGTQSRQDAFNARLRLALERPLGEGWTVRTRVAGRFSTEQDGTDVYLRSYAPTRSGTAFGDITLDEAYLGYQAPDDGLRLRVGRFQTAFSLPGVASKSLDRNDSPNTDVNWNDGVHLDLPVAGGWRGHVIGQYRSPKGSGGVAYAPLDFSDSNSRATLFLGLENQHRLGPITQRMLSLTWMPDSLAARGLAESAREDYVTVDAYVAAEWPLGASGSRFVAGAEIGYALQTPQSAVAGTGGSGDVGGAGVAAEGQRLRLRPEAQYRRGLRQRRRRLADLARLPPQPQPGRDPVPMAVPARDFHGSPAAPASRTGIPHRQPRGYRP